MAHLNLLIRKHDLDMIICVGPGHGAPAVLASLWLEGSLGKFYPKYARDRLGLHNLISKFSTPSGLPRLLRFLVQDIVIADNRSAISTPRLQDRSTKVVSLATSYL